MNLNSLSIQNFLSYGPEITVDLSNLGLVTIYGQNGQGKSSLFSALLYVLYGRTLEGEYGDAVVNNKIKKDCIVKLIIEFNNLTYEIIRTRLLSNTKKPNDIKVLVNSKDITRGTNQDTQELINEIMGMSYKTFLHSVLLHHGGESFCSLDAAAKYQVLEEILDIRKYSKARDLVKLKLKDLVNDIKVLQETISIKTSLINNKKKQLDDCTIKSNNFEKDKNTEISKINNEISTVLARINILPSVSNIDLNKLYKNIENYKLTISSYKQDDLYKLNTAKLKLENEVKLELNKVTNEISRLNLKKAKFISLENTECEECGSLVNEDHTTSHINAIELDLIRLNSDLLYQKSELIRIDTVYAQKAEIVNDKIKVLDNKLLELNDEYTSKLIISQNDDKTLKQKVILEQELGLLKKKLELITKQINHYDSLINSLEEELYNSKEDLNKDSNKLIDCRNNQDYYSFWETGFSNTGIKSLLIENVVNYLTDTAQKYLDLLDNGRFVIKFTATDKFNVEVSNLEGSEAYFNNSKGEKKRIDLAVAWSLGDLAASRSSKSLNIKVLDEQFEALDDAGVESCFSFLNTMTNKFDTILCTTHNSLFKDMFTNSWLVNKTNGFTTIRTNQ